MAKLLPRSSSDEASLHQKILFEMATIASNLRAEAAQGGVKDLGVKESGLEPPLIAVFFVFLRFLLSFLMAWPN